MDVITLAAAARQTGKGAARAVRRAGNVPCVLYGHNVEPVAFQLEEKSLKPLIYTNETRLVQLELDGHSWECIVKDIDFHPVSDRPLHADFQVLQKGEKITLTVPVRYLGTPVGQTEGGNTTFIVTELEIRCMPKDIPSYIDVDISGLDIGDAIHVGALDLPGVEIEAPEDQTLVTVVPPRVHVEPEPEVEEGLLVEGEEGEAPEAEAADAEDQDEE